LESQPFISLFRQNKGSKQMLKIMLFGKRLWAVFKAPILFTLAYVLIAYIPCIFPAPFCLSTTSINKSFGAFSGLTGAILVLISLSKALEKHKGKNLLSHYADLFKVPSGVTANVSFSLPSLEITAKGGPIDLIHKRNVDSLDELQNILYEEISKVKKELRSELTNIEDRVTKQSKAQIKEIQEVKNSLIKLNQNIDELAVGNTNMQVFGAFLVIFSSVLSTF
jgi:hypothetical protein